MNKWFYRAVGAVGVASGVMLLGNGVAHAETVTEAQPTADLQAMRGLVADLFSPTGGLHDLGLSLDMTDTRLNAGLRADGPLSITRGTGDLGLTAYAPGMQNISLTGKAPALTRALPDTGLLNGTTGLLKGAPKEEGGLPGLDNVTGVLSSGPLGGLLGGQPGGSPLDGLSSGPLGGLTGGLTGGADGGGTLGGLTGGLLGSGASPLGGLTGGASPLGGLTGGDGPLGGLTGGVTDLTGGLSGGLNTGGRAADPLAGLTALTGGDSLGALTGGLAGERNDLSAPQPAPAGSTQDTFGEWIGGAPAGLPSDMLMRAPVDPLLGDVDALDPSDSLGVTLDPALSRQVADATSQIVPALIADAMGRNSADDLLATEGAETTEGLPFVDKLPLLGDVLGKGGPLDGVLVVGDIAKQLPGVRDLANGTFSLDTVSRLPIAGNLVTGGIVQGGKPGTGLPVVGSVPIVGDAIGKITGSLNGASPGRGANLLNPAPIAAAQQPVGPQLGGPTTLPAPASQHVGRHRATERPVAGEDAEYAGSPTTEAGLPGLGELPLLGGLTGGGGGLSGPMGGMLGQLPVVNDLPILGNMSTSMEVLRSLPLVGSAAGLLPL
ncbi:hypothetical protein [Catellatospora methionotrophica]|uniref:hypothetical protein n=1 Tax=Catellatospora methionotrophica TaxID=121620 RepID=UPI0033CE855F